MVTFRIRPAFVLALALMISASAANAEVEIDPEEPQENPAVTDATPATTSDATSDATTSGATDATPTPASAPVETLATTQAEDALRRALTGATADGAGVPAATPPATEPVAQVSETAQIDAAVARLDRTRTQLMALIPDTEARPFQILADAIFSTGDTGRWWQFFPVETVREDLEDMRDRLSRGADMVAARDLVGSLCQVLGSMGGAYRADHRLTRVQARADALAQMRKARDYAIQEIERIRARLMRRRDAI